MKKVFLICLLLVSFLGAAQEEFTKKYTHAQAVEFGVKTEIKEETTHVTFNYQGKNQLQITFSEGETMILKQISELETNKDGDLSAVFENSNGTQVIVETPSGGNVLRFVFAENYYITLFNF